jgi:maleate isomerase
VTADAGYRLVIELPENDDDVIHIGLITPHAAAGAEAEFPEMAPGRVETSIERIAAGTRALTDPRIDKASERLAARSVEVIGYASTSYAYAAGFDAEAAMVSRLSRGVGVPVAAAGASAVLALRALDVTRVALVHPPWFDDALDELGSAYFRSQGFGVVSSESAELVNDPLRIEPAAVCEWISNRVPDDAEAVFVGGNGFRAAGAIDASEIAIERPVVTANQVLLWRLLEQAGAELDITGYGRLFARGHTIA